MYPSRRLSTLLRNTERRSSPDSNSRIANRLCSHLDSSSLTHFIVHPSLPAHTSAPWHSARNSRFGLKKSFIVSCLPGRGFPSVSPCNLGQFSSMSLLLLFWQFFKHLTTQQPYRSIPVPLFAPLSVPSNHCGRRPRTSRSPSGSSKIFNWSRTQPPLLQSGFCLRISASSGFSKSLRQPQLANMCCHCPFRSNTISSMTSKP